MDRNAQAVKRKLADHYTEDAPAYHRANYATPTVYSPLQFRQSYIERMIGDCNLPDGAKILDIGCGPGELVLSLTRKGADVWGVDIAEGMIRAAKELLAREDCDPDRLSVGDIENLDFADGWFDAVVASGVIEYQQYDEAALREMNRVLRADGHLILNVTNRYAYLNWIDFVYRWLKKQRPSRAVLEFLKSQVLRRGPLNEFPDRRTHRPATFDLQLARYGFRKVGHRYFHFSPVPMPLNSVLGGWTRRTGRWMERFSDGPVGAVLGGGYLVHARKQRP